MPGSMGSATLDIRVPAKGTDVTFTLPVITNIEVSHYASLSELPTIVMGYKNNFIIDLGTTMKISLTMTRINPASYNDSQNSNPDLWSNGKWYRELEEALDYWQNFGRNSRNEQSGGFVFNYQPSDTSLYPSISRNVFLNGSLSLQYSTTYMVVQMNLTVARMNGTSGGTGRYVTVILHPNGAKYGDEPAEDYVYEVEADTPTYMPNVPADWTNPGYTCMGWSTSNDNTVDYAQGAEITFNYTTSPYEFWAVWQGAIDWWMWGRHATDYEGDIIIPDTVSVNGQHIQTVQYYIVGGGGGGGGPERTTGVVARRPGAGGGSGETKVNSWSGMAPGDVIHYIVGKGGAHGSRPGVGIGYEGGGDGEDGGATSISCSAKFLSDSAGGGEGGEGTSNGSSMSRGGSRYYAGGNTYSGGDGEDGQYGAPNIADNAGKGEPNNGASTATRGGGAGGGAASFRYQFPVGNVTYPEGGGFYESKGGNADEDNNEGRPAIGGGGGTRDWASGNADDGADGIIVLLFFA